MPDALATLRSNDVKDATTFARYCQQELGVPRPRGKDFPILRKVIRELFAENPGTNYYTLCRIVDWAKANKKRYALPQNVVYAFRWAYRDGYLPEMAPVRNDVELEAKITAALAVEQHEGWRYRLLRADGIEARNEVYVAWRQQHKSSDSLV